MSHEAAAWKQVLNHLDDTTTGFNVLPRVVKLLDFWCPAETGIEDLEVGGVFTPEESK